MPGMIDYWNTPSTSSTHRHEYDPTTCAWRWIATPTTVVEYEAVA